MLSAFSGCITLVSNSLLAIKHSSSFISSAIRVVLTLPLRGSRIPGVYRQTFHTRTWPRHCLQTVRSAAFSLK